MTVFLELQARFEEEVNIYWANRLQEEGVRIIPNIPDFKVHAKLLLTGARRNTAKMCCMQREYRQFNESTANVYADDSLLTSDPRIAKEVDKVFSLFETRYVPPVFENLIIAPFEARAFIMRMLGAEIRNARAGKEAWVMLKVNSIVDEEIMTKIYEAGQAGVKIQLIVRGICMLKPGLPGISENIEAVSIVDRFLEHFGLCFLQ